MGKFAIECPKCGSINTASTFVFAKKMIKCGTCGEEINVKTSRLISKRCPHCGSVFVCDQAKLKGKKCPVCGEDIDLAMTATAEYKMATINCPQCACSIEIDKSKPIDFCPICDCKIDTAKELVRAKLVSDTGVSVIQYEGDNSTFIWKHPIEDFNIGTQLIVHESQEAIFFLNGEALDTFGPGRHTLETENLPVLKKLYSLPTGSQTPFHAEVYFINKTVQMGMKWGTDSRVRFIEPKTKIPLNIGASGEMNMQVSDSRKLLIKLVGTTSGLVSKDVLEARADETEKTSEAYRTIRGFFRAPLMTEIKSYLAAVIREKDINILEIDEHMSELSEALRVRIEPKFEEYGLIIPQFYITNILLPEDDKNFRNLRELIAAAYIGVRTEEVKADIAEAARKRQIVEEQTKAQLNVIKAQGEAEALKATGFAEAEIMRAKGYTEKDVIAADVQKAYAEGLGKMGSGGGGGSAGGGIMSDIVGVMAGIKMAGGAVSQIDGIFTQNGAAGAGGAPGAPAAPGAEAATWTCSCGETGNTKNFCMNCGKPKPSSWDCPACGHTGNRGKFCEECGAPKTAPSAWDCPDCGHTGNTGKFCEDCGAKKP